MLGRVFLFFVSTSDTVPSENPRNRRDDIIEAALDVITMHGVPQASLRLIAETAQVSLGSITYHFFDRDTLIAEALHKFADDTVAAFEAGFAEVRSLDEARAAAVRILTESASSRRTTVVGSELYTLSLHRPRHRLLMVKWTTGCRAAMGRLFDEQTTYILDAFYEGLLLHRRMTPHLYSDELVAAAVERLTPPSSYIGPNSDRS